MLSENDYLISGEIRQTQKKSNFSNVRVEFWDKALHGEDIIGSADANAAGQFSHSFTLDHLKSLGLHANPHIFMKAFADEQLVYSGENRRSRTLKPGKNRLSLTLPKKVATGSDALFEVQATRTVPVYDRPGGKQMGKVEAGAIIRLRELAGDGYRVAFENGGDGWVNFADLTHLASYMSDYLGEPNDLEIFPASAEFELDSFDQQGDWQKEIGCIRNSAGLLNDLGKLARGAHHFDPAIMNRFDSMLDLLIARYQPPPRPKEFTLLALRQEVDLANIGLGIPDLNRRYRLPCLLNLRGIHLLGTSIFRSAWRQAFGNPGGINDHLWAGFYVLGQLVSDANIAGAFFHQLRLGRKEFAASVLKSAACTGAFAGRMQPASGELPPDWEPGRFPTLPRPAGWDCRVEQWERSVRAVRCCGQTYRIDEISGGHCVDDVVEIRGVGFGSSRIWPFPHAPDGPPRGRPRELSGPPGPFQSLVYFPDGNGGAVAASEYPEWNDTLVRVVVPEGARSGQLEMRVICDRTFLGALTDLNRCGLETRLPNHRPSRAFWESHVGSLSIEVLDWRGVRVARVELPAIGELPAGPLLSPVGGCNDATLIISGTSLTEIVVTVRDETPITLSPPGSDPVGDFVSERLTLADTTGEDQFVEVTGTDGCGTVLTRVLRLIRTPAISVTVPAGPHDPRTISTLPVEISLSCHPDDLNLRGRDSLPVRARLLSIDGSTDGIALAETMFEFVDRGPLSTTISLASPFIGHGTVQVRANELETASPPYPNHIEGIDEFQISVGAFTGTFTGTGTLNLAAPTGRTLPEILPSPPPYGTGATPISIPIDFAAFGRPDRPLSTVRLAISSFPLDGGITIVQTGGGVGSLDCSSYDLSIPLSVAIEFLGDSVRANLTVTTGSVSSPLFSLTGSAIDTTGAVTLVAAGTLFGGGLILEGFNGLDVSITLTGRIAH